MQAGSGSGFLNSDLPVPDLTENGPDPQPCLGYNAMIWVAVDAGGGGGVLRLLRLLPQELLQRGGGGLLQVSQNPEPYFILTHS